MTDPDRVFARHRTARRRHGAVRGMAVLVAAVFGVLAGGFIQFVSSLPQPPAAAPQADAIVVLTGGRDRIGEALRLLEEDRGARLLISGVNRDVTRAALAAGYNAATARFDCCVDLGFEARTTLGNAAETADWARANGYGSLIVVTSGYHMPRSLHVLQAAMPGVALTAWPVAHPHTGRWHRLAVARILVSEYAKYLVTLVRIRTG